MAEEPEKEGQNHPQEGSQENQQEIVAKEENTEILVKNIPEEATEDRLQTTFEKFGKILNIKIDKDKDGKALGSAIIQFETKQEKDEILNSNEEIELDGKRLEIKDSINDSRTLFVGNIPYNATEQDIYNFFSDCGKVEVKCFYINHEFKGYAHVTFEDDNAVNIAFKKNGEKMGYRTIKIENLKSRSALQDQRGGGGRRGGYQGRGRGRGRPYFGHYDRERNNNDYFRKKRERERYGERDWEKRPYNREKDKDWGNRDQNRRERSREKSRENNRIRDRGDRNRNYHERDGDRERHRYYERERGERIRNDSRDGNMWERERGGSRDKGRDRGDRENERHREYDRERGSRERRHSNYDRERENGYRERD